MLILMFYRAFEESATPYQSDRRLSGITYKMVLNAISDYAMISTSLDVRGQYHTWSSASLI